MAENLSPTTTQKSRSMVASRLQSPTSSFFLGSNDDNLERAQARAARAAAIRRKSLATNVAAASPATNGDSDPCMGKEQILELFQNCIKLASENKINQKNTWELNLIDHLSHIIKVEEEEDVETNFQKASCTLEAGVKIYSLRVDSVHSEAYKVLGGINRAGHDNNQDNMAEAAADRHGQEESNSKQELVKLSPTSTLESSFEALNIKKFDVAFAVDPLYHQTSAQFDEGGAKGLLLNNLGVYGGCRVLFDSSEVPAKCMTSVAQHGTNELIDISFAGDYVEEMVLHMQEKTEISPTLKIIVNQFDDYDERLADQLANCILSQPEAFSLSPSPAEQPEAAFYEKYDIHGDTCDNHGWDGEHDDQTSIGDEGPVGVDAVFPENYEVNEGYDDHNADTDNTFEKIGQYMCQSLGFSSKQNAWAGPDHWKYRKAKGLESGPGAELVSTNKSKNKKNVETDIEFTVALDRNLSDIFVPPKNAKSLLLPVNRVPCSTKLPEDCHYQPEDLLKLFLLPNVMCFGKRQSNLSGKAVDQNDEYVSSPTWGDEEACNDPFYDGNIDSDREDSIMLISQPRKVNKIEVNYDKTSKQVDVQALKEVLWDRVKEYSFETILGKEELVSFRDVVANLSSDCNAAATPEDISPHLCFICLLHLANEHGLSILGCATLDDLTIHVKSCSGVLSSK